MKIHKEGYRIITYTTGFCIVLILGLISYFNIPKPFNYLSFLTIFVFWFIIVRFFRIPNRDYFLDDTAILSPADGTIVAIEDVVEEEYFKDKRKQISVFMSPNNVHVNRYPLNGLIVYTKYWSGSYLVAWHPKSSTENERNTVVIQHPIYGEVLVRQIAGAIARRIVCYSKTNERIEQGKELGFIKFGSRVDVFLPADIEVKVELQQKVKGGITTLAQFKN